MLILGTTGAADGVTVTDVLAEIPLYAAVIVAVPAFPVPTMPCVPGVGRTIATDLSDVAHVTDGVRSAELPSEYRPLAVSCSCWIELTETDGLAGLNARETRPITLKFRPLLVSN